MHVGHRQKTRGRPREGCGQTRPRWCLHAWVSSLHEETRTMPTLSPLEQLNQALRDNHPEAYVSTLHRELGLQPVRFSPGVSHWEWDATQARVLNPFGYVSGGYLTVFADEVLASAIGSVLEPGEFATTA